MSATQTKRQAYRRHASTGRLSRQQRRYFERLRQVTTHGLTTQSGKVIRDLTDAEAATILDVFRTSITGRRNELCGGSKSTKAIKQNPLVVKSQRRTCHVTGNPAQAWKVADHALEQ